MKSDYEPWVEFTQLIVLGTALQIKLRNGYREADYTCKWRDDTPNFQFYES